MKFSIDLDHKFKIVRYRHSGLIYAEDIEEAWSKFLTLREFTELKYNLFSDYRGGRFEIPLEHIAEIIKFMRNIENVVREKKQALLVDEPYSVAASMLFEEEVTREVGFKVQVFTTEKAALKWLTD